MRPPSASRPATRRLLAAAALAAAAPHCGAPERPGSAAFSGPGGMVQAGTAWDRVLVANAGTDTLQVVRLAGSLEAVGMQAAVARYHPAHVYAGANPGVLAASADGAYVFVLDGLGGTVRAVHADSLRPLPAAGAAADLLTLTLAPGGAEPADMVGSTVPCAPPEGVAGQCLGRAFVALRGRGQVLPVSLLQAPDGEARLLQEAPIEVGGRPQRLAVHPTLDLVYVTDAAAPEVVRVDRRGGAPQVARSGLGDVGGPLALSHDGTLLVVGRPRLRDVVIFDNAEGGAPLAAVDADPVMAPAPRCLQACVGGEPSACAGAHPADLGLCRHGDGLGRGPGGDYGATFVGLVPAQIAPSASATQPLALTAGADAAYSEAVAVAGLDGSIVSVGLRRQRDGQLRPRLLGRQDGVVPHLAVGPQQPPPSAYLDACPPAPARARLACVDGAVQVLRGLAQGQTWTFQWEPVYADLPDGGAVDAEGQLRDRGGHLRDLPIDVARADPDLGAGGPGEARPGDIVEVLTAAADTAACRAAQGADPCPAERRVVGLGGGDAEGRWLRLDRPLPPACYPPEVPVHYRLRVGGAFSVRGVAASGAVVAEARLRPGALYGAGTAAGLGQPLLLRLRQLQQSGRSGCETYAADGAVAAGVAQDPLLSRRGTLAFTIEDPYQPLRRGLRLDAYGRLGDSIGKVPGTLLMTRATAGHPAFLMASYGSADAVLVAHPASVGDPGSAGRDSLVLDSSGAGGAL